MVKVIGVQFQKNGKLYHFDANGFDAQPGDYVIVDTSRGLDLGEVIIGTRELNEESAQAPLKKTIRIATEQDIQHSLDNRNKEKEAYSICQKKINEHKLEMKLVSVEYSFDNSKILFFFTANGRVDFRSLVKDLASVFKMRIELRQIGVRDEAKMLGGLGPCGRPICCGSFLDQFQPVSIKMAKEQNLSLNPTKISGVCGRLMCCLKYEQDHYEQTRKRMPKIGKEVSTPDGNGPVTDLNIVKETVFVRLTNGDTSEIKEYPLEEISKIQEDRASQEPVKKTQEKEVKSGGKKDKSFCRNENKDDNAKKQTTENKEDPEKALSQPEKGRERNNSLTRKGALGQPVRRENPNRNTPPKENDSVPQAAPQEKTNQKAEGVSEEKSNWADALQKAMQAINRDE